MAPHDLGTCGAAVASSSSPVRSSSRRSLRGTAGDAPTPSPSTSVAPNDENQDCGSEAAGQRRRNRALKLRQTRNRNAARPQGYMSAEDSDDEEDDVKPDMSSLCGDAMAPGSDKQAWKKQQRMIRNRESAALSRKRKRDRIESLEQQVIFRWQDRWVHLILISERSENKNTSSVLGFCDERWIFLLLLILYVRTVVFVFVLNELLG